MTEKVLLSRGQRCLKSFALIHQKKNLVFPLCKEICFFCAYPSGDKHTEKEIKIQASPSSVGKFTGKHSITPHLKPSDNLSQLGDSSLHTVLPFARQPIPEWLKLLQPPQKRKISTKNIIVTSFKQLLNNVITHYTESCKYTSKPQVPQGVCHTDTEGEGEKNWTEFL